MYTNNRQRLLHICCIVYKLTTYINNAEEDDRQKDAWNLLLGRSLLLEII